MKGEFMSALSEFGMWLVESGIPNHVTLILTSFVKGPSERLRLHYQVYQVAYQQPATWRLIHFFNEHLLSIINKGILACPNGWTYVDSQLGSDTKSLQKDKYSGNSK